MNFPLTIRIRSECKANIHEQINFVKVLQGSTDFDNFCAARQASVSLEAERVVF